MAVIAISLSNILGKQNNLIVHIKRHALSMHPEVLFIGPVVHMNIDRQLVSLYTSTVAWLLFPDFFPNLQNIDEFYYRSHLKFFKVNKTGNFEVIYSYDICFQLMSKG